MKESIVDPAVLEDVVTTEDAPEASAIRELVAEAVDNLDPIERSVVELIVWGRLSKAETGRELNLSRPYIHHIWKRAKGKLRGALGDLPV